MLLKEYVIVGGGVSGLYCAYKIAKRLRDCGEIKYKITVLEKLNRFGGRIMTVEKSGHVMEYGPMRFEAMLQKKFDGLLKELDIKVESFPPYSCPVEGPDYNKINFEEIAAIKRWNKLPPAFALLKWGLMLVLDDQWDVDGDNINIMGRDEKKNWLKKNGMFQGRYLRDHGLWDTLAHVLSKEALDYLQHKGSFYHMLGLNPNAADQICFMLDVLATANDHLITVKGGTYRIIERLLEELRKDENINIVCGVGVDGFREVEYEGGFEVYLTGGDVIKCGGEGGDAHLIFTCQMKAYEKIKGFSEGIRRLLDSVMIVELFKIFVVIENPPFDGDNIPGPNYKADCVPCREIHYGYNSADGTGMVMIYGDQPYLNYWSAFLKGDADKCNGMPEENRNNHLKNHLMHYLRKIFPGALLSIKDYGLLDWSKAPYHTGVHLWKPGCVSEEVMKKLSKFGIGGNIHICGETYSNYQGFIEGCLRTVDGVIDSFCE